MKKKFFLSSKFILIFLLSLGLTSCYQSDNLTQISTPQPSGINNLHQPTAGRANIYILSRYKAFCVVDCPDFRRTSSLLLQNQSQQTLAKVKFFGDGSDAFACYSVKPGNYQFAPTNSPTTTLSRINVKAGNNYYYVQEVTASKPTVYSTNATTANAYIGGMIQREQMMLNLLVNDYLGADNAFGKSTPADINNCSFPYNQQYPQSTKQNISLCKTLKKNLQEYRAPCQAL